MSTSPEASQILWIVIGVLVPFVVILVAIVIVTICLASLLVVTRRKKASVRSFQMDVLTRSVCGGVMCVGEAVMNPHRLMTHHMCGKLAIQWNL
jgi:hypothetical protein